MTRVPDDNRHHRNPMRPNPAKGERREKDVAAERARLSGMRARRRLKDVPGTKRREAVERSLDLGLPSASSINDRDISLFSAAWTRCSRGSTPS